jgi:Sulfotransferase family
MVTASDQPHVDPAVAWAPIFVMGSPRSGTTALALALAAHSALWTSGETHFIFDLFGTGQAEAAFARSQQEPREQWLAAQHVDRAEFLRSLGLGIDSLMRSRSVGRRWIDHTPHHVFMADTLADLFPTAQFIHVIRDGRRVVDSMQHFAQRVVGADAAATDLPPWAGDFTEACRAWASSVQAGLRFCVRHPVRSRTVVNEDMAGAPREHFAMLQRFLGLPEEPGPAGWFSTRRINSSFPGRTHDHGWQRWTTTQQETFERYAADVMTAYGLAREAR